MKFILKFLIKTIKKCLFFLICSLILILWKRPDFLPGFINAIKSDIEKTKVAEETVSLDDFVDIEDTKKNIDNIKDIVKDFTNSELENTEEDLLTVHYIDVGQGDCILITLNDEAMLVDAGNNNKGTLVQKYLMDNNVSELKYVISTHGDADHCGGLDVILEKFPCEKIMMSYFDHDTRTYEDVKNVVKNKRISTDYPIVGDTYEFNEATITFISPYEGKTDTNEASLGFVLNYGDCSYLFASDAEEISLDNNEKVDVLMCPHHGSYSGNNIEKNLQYDYAVISCSGIDYGHPHDSTVKLLKERNVPLFRTDKQGTIISYCNGTDISWNVNPCNDYTQGTSNE